MTEKNQKLLVQLTSDELQEIITRTVSSEVDKIFEKLKIISTEKEQPKIYSREQTAKLLGVSITTLYLWDKSRILQAKRIGSRVYYSSECVMNRIKSNS